MSTVKKKRDSRKSIDRARAGTGEICTPIPGFLTVKNFRKRKHWSSDFCRLILEMIIMMWKVWIQKENLIEKIGKSPVSAKAPIHRIPMS